MAWDREPAITVVSPAAAEARQILRAYFGDVATRYYGRQATGQEIAAAMRDDPSDDLELPHGLLVVARGDGSMLGCAGLRPLPGRIAEVTRVFVIPAGAGWARGSLTAWKLTHAGTGSAC